MSSYTVTEPHPTVPANSYIHSGRGGAGNFFRAPKDITSATGVPTSSKHHKTTNKSSPTAFYSGRGGAGNVRSNAERRPSTHFFEDEDFVARAMGSASETMGKYFHAGRGGAGNVFSVMDEQKKSRRGSDGSTTGSEKSNKSGVLGRLSMSHKQ